MSGSHLYIFRNETVQPPNFQKRIIMFCLPIPTLIYLWEIHIFPGLACLLYYAAAKYVDRSWEYINRSHTHECGNWDWGHAIPRKGTHKNGIFVAVQTVVRAHSYWRMSEVNLTTTSCTNSLQLRSWLFIIDPLESRIRKRLVLFGLQSKITCLTN